MVSPACSRLAQLRSSYAQEVGAVEALLHERLVLPAAAFER